MNKRVCIVGPRRLQNELMASFLERETGIECKALVTFPAIEEERDEHTAFERLILWDCLGKDRETLLSELEKLGEKRFSQDLFALFNVTAGSGIEEVAINWGIKGVFYDNDPAEQFPKGVKALFRGELWLSRQVMTRHILKHKKRGRTYRTEAASLSRREVEVLSMVAIGHTNEEIAAELYISTNTVKTHLYNIFKKINVPNRLQAALWAAKNL